MSNVSPPLRSMLEVGNAWMNSLVLGGMTYIDLYPIGISVWEASPPSFLGRAVVVSLCLHRGRLVFRAYDSDPVAPLAVTANFSEDACTRSFQQPLG